MNTLRTHPLPDLIALNVRTGIQCGRPWTLGVTIVPAEPVRHRRDPNTYGLCISRRWIWDDSPMQCEVLWSRPPTMTDDDVRYLQKKLAAALKLPPSALGFSP